MNVKIEAEYLYKNNLDLYKFKNNKWIKSECKKNKKDVKILTYNLWGPPQDKLKYPKFYKIDTRGNGFVKLLSKIKPDVCCLQEVSKDWLNFFLKSDYIRKKYYITDSNSNRVFMNWGLDNIFLTKVKLDDITVFGLPGMQMDSFLTGCLNGIMLGTFQLHSGSKYTDFRKLQLKTILNIFKNKKFMITGDFNFTDGDPENKILKKIKDPWNIKKNPGYTEDTYINKMRYNIKGKHKQVRFDKFMYNNNKIKVKSQIIVGNEEIKNGIWISDHFGLLTSIHFN
jgi:tyrosyl-DNA phosphodiesterase 2